MIMPAVLEKPQTDVNVGTDVHRSVWRKRIFLAIMLVGIAARCLLIWHPADYHMKNAWREADYTQIARAFYREGMNILYPRVDWRGDGPGFVEMELPILPWTAALLYYLIGYQDVCLRILSAACGIGSVFAFWRLARRLLDADTAIIALLLFSVNGLLISLSGAIQPESLMILIALLAANGIYRWRQTDSSRDLYLASLWLALAILSKASMAPLGLLFVFLWLQKLSGRNANARSILLAGGIAVLPPGLWYIWAHHQYLTTGLSLGLSNETHLLSWIMVLHPVSWMKSLLLLELREVLGYAGVIFVLLSIFSRQNVKNGVSVWYFATLLFYVVAADTTADGWAYYYHAVSSVPAVLLMASGLRMLIDHSSRNQSSYALLRPGRLAAGGLAAITVFAMAFRGASLIRSSYNQPELREMYDCVRTFASLVPPESKIVVRGGSRFDMHGHPVAFNESMPFLWMDRKGFNYAREDYSLNTFNTLRERGAEFWLAKPDDLRDTVVFKQIQSGISSLADCGTYRLFKFTVP
jgi:4-amino-4-deoxy-L-arabinose transferase-like glycosyltransferase